MLKAFSLPVAVLLSTVLAPTVEAQQNGPAALETIRNYQVVSDRLASAGQISYEQIPLLGTQGYEVVVNLASADAERNGQEGFLVAQSGLTYVHIPVDWERPRLSDVEMFFDVMKANEDRKVFVHCFANMRASAFVYMYRTLVEGVPEPEARGTMSDIWDPDRLQQWAGLIEQVRREHAGRQ
ncbi:MAG: protein tyrosine phosphatase family protein [Gemmatimonadota bacterium]|nr:protein tyrosine phosphatase family protein [Gemmatimonadota bacterium]